MNPVAASKVEVEEDKENIVIGKDMQTHDNIHNENTHSEVDEYTKSLISDIAIDEEGNIITIPPKTPLKDITQQQQSHSIEPIDLDHLKRDHSADNDINPQYKKKVHLIGHINFDTTLEVDYMTTLLQLESDKQVKHGFISLQPEITSEMRATLVDWMSDVVNWVPYNEETFFLAVNYVDRYLSVRGVRKNLLQLLGVAALHTAGKYEEVDPPSCTMLAPLAGKRESCKRVNSMELKIGTAINFDYNVATHLAFLKALCLFDESNVTTSSEIFTSAVVKINIICVNI